MNGEVTQLAFVTLVVPDYDAGLAFFTGTLGWQLVCDVALDNGRRRWVRVAPTGGGCGLLLAKATTPAQRRAIGAQTGGRVGFFLETDTFDETYGQMRAAGVTFLEAPRHEPYGWVVKWQDPFGNRWDLLERRGL